MESKPINQTKARLIVVGVFVLGLVAGALLMNLYQHLAGPGGPDHVPRGKPSDYMFQKLNSKLDLNQDQQQQIREILHSTFDQYAEIRKDIDPRINAVRQQERDKIRALLTPEQLAKFEDMVRDFDSKREKMKDEHR